MAMKKLKEKMRNTTSHTPKMMNLKAKVSISNICKSQHSLFGMRLILEPCYSIVGMKRTSAVAFVNQKLRREFHSEMATFDHFVLESNSSTK